MGPVCGLRLGQNTSLTLKNSMGSGLERVGLGHDEDEMHPPSDVVIS